MSEYTTSKFVILHDTSIQCVVKYNANSIDQLFRPIFNESDKAIIFRELEVDELMTGHVFSSAVITKLPSIGGTSMYTGKLEISDWKSANGKLIEINGDLRCMLTTLDASSSLESCFLEVQCISGFAYL